jgi:hypothetical protein
MPKLIYKGNGKAVPALNELGATPWRRTGEWTYSYPTLRRLSLSPQSGVDVSGTLYLSSTNHYLGCPRASIRKVGLEVLTAVVMKSSMFWNISWLSPDHMALYPRRMKSLVPEKLDMNFSFKRLIYRDFVVQSRSACSKSYNIYTYLAVFNPLRPSGYYMYHLPQTSQNSEFCPQSVSVCSVWFSQ